MFFVVLGVGYIIIVAEENCNTRYNNSHLPPSPSHTPAGCVASVTCTQICQAMMSFTCTISYKVPKLNNWLVPIS